MASYNVTQFDGLVVGLDARQAAKPSVLDGKNFQIIAEGPKSSFASEFLTYQKFSATTNLDVFDLDTEFLFFSDNAIYEYDFTSRSFVPRYILSAPATANFPWSAAFVGLRWYFTKPGANLIEYDIDNNIWSEITANIPVGLKTLTESGGRLVLAGDTEIVWSGIDDGTNLVPDVDLGIGAQVLSIVGNGQTIGIKPFSNGFVVYTTTGRLIAETTDLILPFRFTPIRDRLVPIDQYGLTDLDQTSHVVLTSSGLYRAIEFRMEPLFQTLSEHLRQKEFLRISPRILGAYRIFYDQERQLFFLSVSEQGVIGQYSYAYNVYLPLDKVGLFNYSHANLCLLPTTETTSKIDDIGFVDPDGFIHVLTDNRQTEFFVQPAFFIHKFDNLFIPPRTQDGVAIFSDFIVMNTSDISVISNNPDGFFVKQDVNSIVELSENELFVGVRTVSSIFSDGTEFSDGTQFLDVTIFPDLIQMGVGFINEQITGYSPTFQIMDSFIQLGLFRLTDEEKPGRLQEIDRIIAGAENRSVLIDIEDLELVSPDTIEDLQLVSGTEDLGENDNPFGSNSYRLRIIGTIDGETVYEDNNEIAEEIDVFGTERIFTCHSIGLYHSVIFEPENIGDSFLISTLEMSAYPGDWIDA